VASEDQYENVESLRMMTKVSHLYHSKSMVQTDIAKKLGLSQARVSRLLSSAEERGIVRRIVVPPAGLFSELERQIEEKFVAGEPGVGVCDMSMSIKDNLTEYARAAKKDVTELLVAVLDRDYNEDVIDEVRSAGAATRLLRDGDVAGGIQAARSESRIDMCIGKGGSPEGIVTACGVRALGGFMQGKLAPRDESEIVSGNKAGLKFDYVYQMDELVNSDNTFFVATGVTDGPLVSGVRKKGNLILAESIVIRGKTGTVRKIFAEYQAARWL